ncbi:hypothetical protein BROUX41_003823 [Berkeleyomyces rouxiae]|uniref:uncharacterized protein n=1 Tax=Berkeleyomyces rouxiae TaxID=2035830 RepID=UPI003B7F4CCD
MTTFNHMTPAERSEWSEVCRKWDSGIRLTTATHTEMREYAEYFIRGIDVDDNHGEPLWELFQEMFKRWTLHNFKELEPRIRQALRTKLLTSGVYVAESNKKITATVAATDFLAGPSGQPSINYGIEPVIKTELNIYPSPFGDHHLETGPKPEEPRNLGQTPHRGGNPSGHQKKKIDQYPPPADPEMMMRQVRNLMNFITDTEKFGGDEDESFQLKLRYFETMCDSMELSRKTRTAALAQFFKGRARTAYNADELVNLPYEEVYNYYRQNFEGLILNNKTLATWNRLTLKLVQNENPYKNLH